MAKRDLAGNDAVPSSLSCRGAQNVVTTSAGFPHLGLFEFDGSRCASWPPPQANRIRNVRSADRSSRGLGGGTGNRYRAGCRGQRLRGRRQNRILECVIGVGSGAHFSRGVECRAPSCSAGIPSHRAAIPGGIDSAAQRGAEGGSGRGPRHPGGNQRSVR